MVFRSRSGKTSPVPRALFQPNVAFAVWSVPFPPWPAPRRMNDGNGPALAHCRGNREGITVYHTVINSSAQRNSLTRPRPKSWRELKTTRRGAKKLGYHPSNNNHTWHARRRGYADRDPTCRGTAASPAFLSRHRNHRRAPDPGGRHRQPRRPHPHHRCRRCRRCHHRCRRHRPHHRSFPRLRRCPHRPSETATP